MDATHTSPRLARKRTAATTDANERNANGARPRAAYATRATNRAHRQAVRVELRSLVR